MMSSPPALKVLDMSAHSASSNGLDSGPSHQVGDDVATERLIGALLDAKAMLGPDKVDRILEHARAKGLRFGDAAVALGLVSQDQVLQALSEQFGYAYSSEERRKLMPELVVLNQPFSMQAESIREVRSQLLMRLYANNQARPALARNVEHRRTRCVFDRILTGAEHSGGVA